MPRTFRTLLLALLVAAPLACQRAADDAYRAESITLEDGELAGSTFAYRIHVPGDIGPGERLPVVLFLHGAGERGDDNRRQLEYLPTQLVREPYASRYRAIVVAPQCPRRSMWMDLSGARQSRVTGDSPQLDVAWAALQRTLAEEPCDLDRIYLTGLSMGGYGSWHLAARHPETFAAVLPVCGGGDPAKAAALAKLPIWAWHGAEDRTVPPSQSLDMVRAIRAVGGIVHYRELPGVGHNSWSAAYGEDGGLDWLFGQRRGRPTLGWVVACDQAGPRLLILDLDRQWRDGDALDPAAVVWEWTPARLPDEQRAWFQHPDEVKPVDDGRALLVTASGGGFFKIRIADGKVLAAANPGGNPHSAAELPGGQFVVASSTGDSLTHYRLADGALQKVGAHEVVDAHGVEWDATHQRLWVLGGKVLVSFVLEDGALREVSSEPLPVTEESAQHERHGGHDLAPLPGLDTYLVTDMERVYVFDPAAEGAARFTPFAPLPKAADVKSIGAVRSDGPWVGLQATEEWYSDRLLFVPAKGGETLERVLPGGKVYKFRPMR